MCRETCVYSATVRDVLTLWHPVEFKGLFTHIKNNPKYNNIPLMHGQLIIFLAIIIIVREARISLILPSRYHEWKQQQLPSRFHVKFGLSYSGTLQAGRCQALGQQPMRFLFYGSQPHSPVYRLVFLLDTGLLNSWHNVPKYLRRPICRISSLIL